MPRSDHTPPSDRTRLRLPQADSASRGGPSPLSPLPERANRGWAPPPPGMRPRKEALAESRERRRLRGAIPPEATVVIRLTPMA